jgi:hypothetical protein
MKKTTIKTLIKSFTVALLLISMVSCATAYAGVEDRWNDRGTTDDITGISDSYATATSTTNAYGGAIYYTQGNGIGLIYGDYKNNYVQTVNGGAYGGAIYALNGNITITTGRDVGTGEIINTLFQGNYTRSNLTTTKNAIFMAVSDNFIPTLTIDSRYSGGVIAFNDGGAIDGGRLENGSSPQEYRASRYNVNLTGVSDGIIDLRAKYLECIEDPAIFDNHRIKVIAHDNSTYKWLKRSGVNVTKR